MTGLYNQAHSLVEREGLDIGDFQAILNYLLSNGVIVRDDSKREEKYYDWFVRLKTVISDYFALSGIKLYHDEDLLSIRIYSQESETPVDVEDTYYGDESNNLSKKLDKAETAYLITLALIYDQKIEDGEINDLDMTVEVGEDELVVSLNTYVGDILSRYPKSKINNILSTLKRIRVIDYGEHVFSDSDNPLIIRPFIQQIILPGVLKQFKEDMKLFEREEADVAQGEEYED